MIERIRAVALTQIYVMMLRIRLFEERLVYLYPAQEIKTPVHLSIGQEAIAAGVCQNLTKSDYVFTNHRCHGHCLAKGMSMSAMMAELYGKNTGCCKGKGGSMHLSDPQLGILATSAIVGANLPIAVGAALSLKLRERKNISVVFFGDGAVDQGVFFESLNFAALKKLPVLFVCENNFYATNSLQKARQPLDNIFKRAEIFGIKGWRCAGNDAQEVYDLAKRLIQKLRANSSGPHLLECRTYRWKAHVGPDCDFQSGCRPKPELDAWISNCPIKKLEIFLIKTGLLTQDKIRKIRQRINREIMRAEFLAKKSRFPSAGELTTDVYWKE